jgi:RNA polymerase sigma factor (sigma-70 family)
MQVREALMKLGERERRVLILRVYLDLPWAEVAAAAGLTEAGARTRYYRAMDRLRPLHVSQEALT